MATELERILLQVSNEKKGQNNTSKVSYKILIHYRLYEPLNCSKVEQTYSLPSIRVRVSRSQQKFIHYEKGI